MFNPYVDPKNNKTDDSISQAAAGTQPTAQYVNSSEGKKGEESISILLDDSTNLKVDKRDATITRNTMLDQAINP